MTPIFRDAAVEIGPCSGDGLPGVFVWVDPSELRENGAHVQLLVSVDDARYLAGELERAARSAERIADESRRERSASAAATATSCTGCREA